MLRNFLNSLFGPFTDSKTPIGDFVKLLQETYIYLRLHRFCVIMTYVDEESFSLEVTQAEPNVFWKKRGRKPRRVEGARQCFLLRQGMLWKAPFIPLAYLNEMSLKLRLILNRNDTEAARYIDEYDLLSKNDEFVALLNKIMDGLSDGGTD